MPAGCANDPPSAAAPSPCKRTYATRRCPAHRQRNNVRHRQCRERRARTRRLRSLCRLTLLLVRGFGAGILGRSCPRARRRQNRASWRLLGRRRATLTATAVFRFDPLGLGLRSHLNLAALWRLHRYQAWGVCPLCGSARAVQRRKLRPRRSKRWSRACGPWKAAAAAAAAAAA